jgi:hypothetical protein
MFHFTIRELALITIIAAGALGWWLDHRANAAAAEDAKFLANVATHGCHCQLVDQFLALQEKYGVAPLLDLTKWQALTDKRRQISPR